MKIQRVSLDIVFYFLILANGSIQAADYHCPVQAMPSTNEKRSPINFRDFTPVKKSISELPTTINGIPWPVRSSFGGRASLMDEAPPVVEVNSDITTNTIWQESNVYHVAADIQVQALLVIEPGTTITFAENACIRVNNGGCLSACGTPEKIIQFLPDETISQYMGAFLAIYIEATASPATQVRYSLFKQAYTGIFTGNMRLDTAIHHNYFNYCVYGVVEQGTELTDVFNNQFYMSYAVAVYVDVVSSDNQESSASEILIQNNTCNYVQYYAIAVLGANAEANKGRIRIANNILSNAYCGIYWAYYAWLYPANNGYYNNYANRNFTYEEGGCVEMAAGAESPFETGAGDLDQCYLKQSCPFIDAGCIGINMDEETVGSFTVQNGDVSQIPQILGFTTALNSDCDLGVVDIGFHYPNFDKVNVGEYAEYLISDLNQDGTVNDTDLTILRSNYGQAGSWSEGDINSDGIVDAHDLRILRKQWGQNGTVHPIIVANVSGDSSNLSNVMYLTVTGYSTETSEVLFFMDGAYLGKLRAFRDGQGIGIDTTRYNNGDHQLKVVCINDDIGSITLAANTNLTFNNTLYCQCSSGSYKSGNDYYFQAFYNGTENISISLVDVNNNTIWSTSSSISDNSINVTIPQSSLTDQIYQLVIDETASGQSDSQSENQIMASESYKQWKKILSKKFDKTHITTPVVALITLNDPDTVTDDWDCVAQVIGTLKRYPNFIVLYNGETTKNCTWDNFSYLIKNADTLGIHYWYHAGHGSNITRKDSKGTINFVRTGIMIDGNPVLSFSKADFGGSVPSWFKEDTDTVSIDGGGRHPAYEKTILSLTKSYLSRDYSPFNIVFIDSCSSEQYLVVYNVAPHGTNYIPHDLAYALGMYTNYYQAYFGWEGKRWYNGWWSTSDSDFVEYFWERLGLMDSVGTSWYTSGSYYQSAHIFDRTHLLSIGDPWTLFLWDY